ncbi:MAG: cupin domain-containing protein [Chitinophagaceae bacterium]|nr:cupin domain-containing protein [Chitinophagaceae bacterium]
MNAKQYITALQLEQHPEGGFFRQSYRSNEWLPATALPARFKGNRSFSTAIYYLLEQGDFSSFHKIKSDECWHFYSGGTLYIHVIENAGIYYRIKLGNLPDNGELFQFVVPAGAWFAAEPAPETPFALTGCTVAPGFDFEDFEMGDKTILLTLFPQHSIIVNRLCR